MIVFRDMASNAPGQNGPNGGLGRTIREAAATPRTRILLAGPRGLPGTAYTPVSLDSSTSAWEKLSSVSPGCEPKEEAGGSSLRGLRVCRLLRSPKKCLVRLPHSTLLMRRFLHALPVLTVPTTRLKKHSSRNSP